MELALERTAVDGLISGVKKLHETHAGLQDFIDWPKDMVCADVEHFAHPSIPLFENDPHIQSGPYTNLIGSLRAVSRQAAWRETYKGTPLFDQIMHRFGCFEIIGYDGFMRSNQMRSFMVYMPPGFHYPWHEHPAEQLYLVLSGEATFQQQGQPARRVTPGETVYHASGIPHATTTTDQPVVCYVLWRNHFDTPPVWSPT